MNNYKFIGIFLILFAGLNWPNFAHANINDEITLPNENKEDTNKIIQFIKNVALRSTQTGSIVFFTLSGINALGAYLLTSSAPNKDFNCAIDQDYYYAARAMAIKQCIGGLSFYLLSKLIQYFDTPKITEKENT